MKQLTKDEFPKYISSLYTRKTNNPIKKWGKDLNRHFSKQDIQIANRHMKRCPTLLIIREMQPNHNEMSPHTGQDRSLLEKCNQNHNEMSPHTGQDGHRQKKSINNKCWRGCGEKGTLLHCWWESKLIQPLWKMVCHCCCCCVASVVSASVRPHRRQPTRLPVPGILQARTLEWVAIAFSNA